MWTLKKGEHILAYSVKYMLKCFSVTESDAISKDHMAHEMVMKCGNFHLFSSVWIHFESVTVVISI